MNLRELKALVEKDAEAQRAYNVSYDASKHYPGYGDYVRLKETADDTRLKLTKALVEMAPYLVAQAENGERSAPLVVALEKVAEDPDVRYALLKEARGALKEFKEGKKAGSGTPQVAASKGGKGKRQEWTQVERDAQRRGEAQREGVDEGLARERTEFSL